MSKTYSGFIAIIGPTNAGKSTLMNQIMGRKVSIVSHKVQTTRTRLRAIKMVGDKQLIFIDTPGYHDSEKKLNLRLRSVTESQLEDIDAVLYVIDSTREPGEEESHGKDNV